MTALPPLTALAPLLLLGVAALSLSTPGHRPGALPKLAEGATLGALALSLAGLAQLLWSGPATLSIGHGAALLALRLDAVSVSMAVLVSFVGWIVVRYSRTYLDGEAREGRFHGLMLATLAAVLALVQAGSLTVVVAGFIAPRRAGRRQSSLSSGARATSR
jgi:NAD(P)H-quinone oxidoreductase subunit 5